MFDYVHCELPLPDGWQADELQTKDFDCTMVTHVISSAGRLLVDRGPWTAIPEAQRPYPNSEGLRGLVGSMRHTPKYEDTNYHGIFRFHGLETIRYEPDPGYGSRGKPIYKPHHYEAKFTDGQLVGIKLVAHEVVPDRAQGTWHAFFTEAGIELAERNQTPMTHSEIPFDDVEAPKDDRAADVEETARLGDPHAKCSKPSAMVEHPCHYTGKPAYADVQAGIIDAGYGSRHDMARFVFVTDRPLDLPEGAWLSDEILELWVAEGRIALVRDDGGSYPLSQDTLARAFDANRHWATIQLRRLVSGEAAPVTVVRIFVGVGLGEEPDPVRLALVAAVAEAIGGRTVCLDELLAARSEE